MPALIRLPQEALNRRQRRQFCRESETTMSSMLQEAKAASTKVGTLFTSLARFIGSKPVPVSNEPPLCMLPEKMLQIITDFLPLNSAACLILCSRKLLLILGNRAWYSLRLDNNVIHREHFLELLEKDIPRWQLCHNCSVFHPYHKDTRPTYLENDQSQMPCFRAHGFIWISPRITIYYNSVQRIMNQHRFDWPHMINFLSLSHKSTYSIKKTVIDVETRAEIVADELFLHVSKRLRICAWDLELIGRTIGSFCQHLPYIHLNGPKLRTILGCPSHPNEKYCKVCTRWFFCPECPTKLTIATTEDKNSGITIQVDIIRNLGGGNSSLDPTWVAQSQRITGYDVPRRRTVVPTSSIDEGERRDGKERNVCERIWEARDEKKGRKEA